MQSIESRMECVAQLKEDNRMLKIKTEYVFFAIKVLF